MATVKIRQAQLIRNPTSLLWDVRDTHTQEKVIANCREVSKANELLDRMGYALVNQ